MQIRTERPSDHAAIRDVIRRAFAAVPHSSHNEHDIVDSLRDADALLTSLVAVDNNELIGCITCSPIDIDRRPSNWAGLGPVGVRPERQRLGVGQALVCAAIEQLKLKSIEGIVLLGNPAYYSRFGFRHYSTLRYPEAPSEYFLALPLRESIPSGIVNYHGAFAATPSTDNYKD